VVFLEGINEIMFETDEMCYLGSENCRFKIDSPYITAYM
jgi:hypothetical protein